MKYLATIKFGKESNAQSFDTIKDAEFWLDSQNNNAEHTTIIAQVDDKWIVQDWFYYTKGIE